MENIEKQITTVKQQTTKMLNAANELTILNDSDLSKATDALAVVKNLGKQIKERKEQITKPLLEALNSARDLFKPLEQSHVEAERIIKVKILNYQDEQDKKRKEEAEKIALRVEKGTLKQETAMKKLENLPEVQTTTVGKIGKTSTRIIKKVRITPLPELQLNQLQLNVLIKNGIIDWNESRVRELALKGQLIPGVQVYEEKTLSSTLK